jgi:hypothetical protein
MTAQAVMSRIRWGFPTTNSPSGVVIVWGGCVDARVWQWDVNDQSAGRSARCLWRGREGGGGVVVDGRVG